MYTFNYEYVEKYTNWALPGYFIHLSGSKPEMSISFLAEWEPDPLWRAEVYLAVFQVFMTGRGRIFSKEDVGKVANANGICGF